MTGIAVVDPKNKRTEVLVSSLRYLSVVVGLTTGASESLAPDAPRWIAVAWVCVQGRRNKGAIRS